MGCHGVIIFLLFHLFSVGVKSASEVTEDCYWSGTSPICNGSCRPGETVAAESHKGDGKGCMIGKMKYCCKNNDSLDFTQLPAHTKPLIITSPMITTPPSLFIEDKPTAVEQMLTTTTRRSKPADRIIIPIRKVSVNLTKTEDFPVLEKPKLTKEIATTSLSAQGDCYWIGTPPICKGNCNEGEVLVNSTRTGDGSTCIIGKMKYCCKVTASRLTLLKDKVVTMVTTTARIKTAKTTRPDIVNLSNTVSPVHKKADLIKKTLTSTSSSNTANCYWVGTPPNCEKACNEGDRLVSTARIGNGTICTVGIRKRCCKGSNTSTFQDKNGTTASTPRKSIPVGASIAFTEKTITTKHPNCYWSGNPPACEGSCRVGEYVAALSSKGDGETCESGKKKLCCPRRKPTTMAPDVAESVTQSAVITTTTIESVNNITATMNSSSQPDLQQVTHRPTPSQSDSTTARRRPKVFSRERKLAVSTLATSFMPARSHTTTSTSTPEVSTSLVTSETSTSLLTTPTTSQAISVSSTTSQTTPIPSTMSTTSPTTPIPSTKSTTPPTTPIPSTTSTTTLSTSTTLQTTPIPSTTSTTLQTTLIPSTTSTTPQTTPISSTTTLSTSTLAPTATFRRRNFLPIRLPDVLPVPLMFRSHSALFHDPANVTELTTTPFMVANTSKKSDESTKLTSNFATDSVLTTEAVP